MVIEATGVADDKGVGDDGVGDDDGVGEGDGCSARAAEPPTSVKQPTAAAITAA